MFCQNVGHKGKQSCRDSLNFIEEVERFRVKNSLAHQQWSEDNKTKPIVSSSIHEYTESREQVKYALRKRKVRASIKLSLKD